MGFRGGSARIQDIDEGAERGTELVETLYDTLALESGERLIGGAFVINLIPVVLDYTLQFPWDLGNISRQPLREASKTGTYSSTLMVMAVPSAASLCLVDDANETVASVDGELASKARILAGNKTSETLFGVEFILLKSCDCRKGDRHGETKRWRSGKSQISY